MILIDNRNVLRVKNRNLLDKLTEIENSSPTGNVILEQAKTGAPTLKIVIDGRKQYVHSKYDPEKDADRFISKLEGGVYKHVLFVGAGLGYHIQKFIEAHPDTKFSIYEPDEEVLLAFLAHVKLGELSLHNLTQIFTGTDANSMIIELQKVLQSASSMLQIITLPVYEKMYGQQVDAITKEVVETLKFKRAHVATNSLHQKRWTINSMKNFPVLLKTPNILHDIDRSLFQGKPALIVAAGPSLNEEIENIRYIKQRELAYIVSVGSSINSLIEHGIYPDVVCSFDPSVRNQFVIQKIKDHNITEIPLVFGSSIGFETLEGYPGKMLHMITGPDTVSPQLLDTTQSIDIVWDAPTVAAVTFQLLSQLQCNPIILVGQNLAYQGNKRYASGIKYDFIENELDEKEQRNTVTVKDVYGNDIDTSDSFNSMRRQLELYIQMNENIEVINTTKGGAHIEGASFLQLDELIKDRLQSQITKFDWTEKNNSYDIEFIMKRLQLLTGAERDCKTLIQNALNELEKINLAVEKRRKNNVEQRFAAFDKQFVALKQNAFYSGFIEPMVKVQNERLAEESQFIRYEPDVLKKAAIIVQVFGVFLQEIHLHHEFVLPYFEEMKSRIEEITIEIENR